MIHCNDCPIREYCKAEQKYAMFIEKEKSTTYMPRRHGLRDTQKQYCPLYKILKGKKGDK